MFFSIEMFKVFFWYWVRWYVGNFEIPCPTECGLDESTQTRVVECQNDGVTVEDELCNETKPNPERICAATENCRNFIQNFLSWNGDYITMFPT